MNNDNEIEVLEKGSSAANLVEQGLSLMRIENETQMKVAIQKPRQFKKIRKDVMEELETIPEFAMKSYYSIPYKNDMGGTTYVEGPSIKSAMALARQWGNCSNGARIVDENADRIIVEGVFVDYETNLRTLRQYSVSRGYWSKQSKRVIPLREDRLNMAIQAGMSKAVRNAILASLPISLVEAYIKKAKYLAIQVSGQSSSTKKILPIPERIAKAFDMFKTLGVTKEQWDAYISDSSLEPDELLAHIIGLYSSIKDGERTIADIFGETAIPQTEEKGQISMSEVFNAKPKPIQ